MWRLPSDATLLLDQLVLQLRLQGHEQELIHKMDVVFADSWLMGHLVSEKSSSPNFWFWKKGIKIKMGGVSDRDGLLCSVCNYSSL